jgi:hypothetical protein
MTLSGNPHTSQQRASRRRASTQPSHRFYECLYLFATARAEYIWLV